MFIIDLCIEVWNDIFLYFFEKDKIDIEDYYNKNRELYSSKEFDFRLLLLITLTEICDKVFIDLSYYLNCLNNIHEKYSNSNNKQTQTYIKEKKVPYEEVSLLDYSQHNYNIGDTLKKILNKNKHSKIFCLFIGGKKSLHIKIKSAIATSPFEIRF
jgi:hypothetical protein